MSSVVTTSALQLPGRPGDATFRGLTLSGTRRPFVLRGLEPGTFGVDSMRTDDRDAPQADGARAGEDYLPGRSIRGRLGVADNPSDLLGPLLDELAGAWAPIRDGLSPLVYWRPRDVGPRVWWVRPRRLAIPVDAWTSSGLQLEIPAEWFAPDPRRYGTAVHSRTLIADPGAVDGRAYDLTFDRDYPDAAAGLQTADNAGNVTSYPRVTLVGELVDPFLENVTTGERIDLSGTIAAGQTFVVDMQDRTVLEGTASRYSYVAPGPEWWGLVPGENDVRLGATSGTGYATVEWRHAHL